MKVAFTGHRPHKLGGYDDSKNKRKAVVREIDIAIKELSQEINYYANVDIEIISGMALGVDQWAAEYAILNGHPLLSYVPCDNQDRMWQAESKTIYRELLDRSTRIKECCPGPYANWKMQKRNQDMVDDCDVLIAVWNGTSGGTCNCVKYAEEQKKRIIKINPEKL